MGGGEEVGGTLGGVVEGEGLLSAKAKTWTSCLLELTARRREREWIARPQALMPTFSWKKGVGGDGSAGAVVALGDGEEGCFEAPYKGVV